MAGALSHRGPDEFGVYRDRRAGLAHARLSIIDLATGQQPLVERARHAVGRLQRRDLQLRRAARASWQAAATASGPAATPKSSSTPTRSGATTPSAASTASGRSRCGTPNAASWSWRAIPSACGRSTSPSTAGAPVVRQRGEGDLRRGRGRCRARSIPRASTQLFTFWTPVAPQTVFAGVDEVEPGTVRVYSATAMHAASRLRSRRFPRTRRRSSAARSTTRSPRSGRRWRDATSLRMLRADVPVGSYLSGGLDSSLVAALGLRAKGEQLPDLLAAVRGRRVRRDRVPAPMVEQLGSDHHEVLVVARRHRAGVSRRDPPHRAADPAHRAGAAVPAVASWCTTPASRSC